MRRKKAAAKKDKAYKCYRARKFKVRQWFLAFGEQCKVRRWQ